MNHHVLHVFSLQRGFSMENLLPYHVRAIEALCLLLFMVCFDMLCYCFHQGLPGLDYQQFLGIWLDLHPKKAAALNEHKVLNAQKTTRAI